MKSDVNFLQLMHTCLFTFSLALPHFSPFIDKNPLNDQCVSRVGEDFWYKCKTPKQHIINGCFVTFQTQTKKVKK